MNFVRIMSRRHAISVQGEDASTLRQAEGRIQVLKLAFLVILSIVTLRVTDVSLFHAAHDVISRDNNKKIAEMRGDIVDRNGVLLATSLKTPSLFVDPHLVADKKNTALMLSRIFPDIPHDDLQDILQSDKRFVWIKRGITPAQQHAVLYIGEPGLNFRYEPQRFYPQSEMVAHLMGTTDTDQKGIAGLEKSYNEQLMRGKDISLTLDTRIQHILRREIKNQVNTFSAIGGMGVVMNIHTGDVLAGVSYPDYHPARSKKTMKDALFNRLSVGTYEFGSVFKIFSTAAFLENYNVPLSTTFDARKPLRSGRHVIRDYHAENKIMTVPEVFMVSSNIGSAMMGEAIGKEKMQAFYRDLGLMNPLHMDLHENAAPQIPRPWRDINTLTASYGHGIAVTPMHVASAMATIVNGGYSVNPNFILKGNDATATKVSVLSPETSTTMRKLLRLVVTDGTGKKADAKGYNIGGKTGTAEKPGQRGYDRKRLISSFLGAFPMDDPQYVIFIAIDEPKGTKDTYGYATAGWVAAPAVKKVVESMASVLGISPQITNTEQDISHSLKQYVSLAP